MKLTNIRDMDEECRLNDKHIIIKQCHLNERNTPIKCGEARGYNTKHPNYS